MPFGDLFKLPEGFKRRRSAPNRMEGLTFPQKINYMGQFEGPSLMALGAGISSGHPEQGWADMAKIQAGYQGAYADEAEQDRTRAETMQYLIQNGIDPGQAEAAAQNPEILRHIFNLEEEKQRVAAGGRDQNKFQPVMMQRPDGSVYYASPNPVTGTLDPYKTGEGDVPIDPYTGAAMKAGGGVYGKEVETARLLVPQAQAHAEDVKRMSASVLNDPYLDQMFGAITAAGYDLTGGWLSKADLPNISPDASRVMGNLKRLMGQSFLAARESLANGGQITDYEGRKADEAFNTIGSAKTTKDLRTAIEEFQYWIDRGVQKLQVRAGAQPNAGGNVEVPVTPAVAPPSLQVQPGSGGAPAAPAAPAQPGQPAPADPLQIRPRL